MTAAQTLHLLSGGAAQGLVGRLAPEFTAQTGCLLDGRFDAVGAVKERLLAGQACDVIILTQALIDQLTADGHLVSGTARTLGVVKTGVAVKSLGAGHAPPEVSTAQTLKSALLSATGIFFPDPVKATAGIHVMKVLKALDIDTLVAQRLRPYPNGATAMRAMAESSQSGLIGCTQVTEILITPGVMLVAELPREFELATTYTAAVCKHAAHPGLALDLIARLAAAEHAATRRAAGFG